MVLLQGLLSNCALFFLHEIELFVGEKEWEEIIYALSKGSRNCMGWCSWILGMDFWSWIKVSLLLILMTFHDIFSVFCFWGVDTNTISWFRAPTGFPKWLTFFVYAGLKSVAKSIQACQLSPATLYTAHLVFKLSVEALSNQPIQVTMGIIGGEEHTRTFRWHAERVVVAIPKSKKAYNWFICCWK